MAQHAVGHVRHEKREAEASQNSDRPDRGLDDRGRVRCISQSAKSHIRAAPLSGGPPGRWRTGRHTVKMVMFVISRMGLIVPSSLHPATPWRSVPTGPGEPARRQTGRAVVRSLSLRWRKSGLRNGRPSGVTEEASVVRVTGRAGGEVPEPSRHAWCGPRQGRGGVDDLGGGLRHGGDLRLDHEERLEGRDGGSRDRALGLRARPPWRRVVIRIR